MLFYRVKSCFRPLAGMVLSLQSPLPLYLRFRPLTGMVQIWNEWFRDQNLFSPHYGDSTPTYVRFLVAEHVFAPLRGWYLCVRLLKTRSPSFRPLAGIVLMMLSLRPCAACFRPLEGIASE